MTHRTEMRSIFLTTFHSTATTTSKLKKYKFFRFINPKTDQNLFPDNTIVEHTIAATAEQKKTNTLMYFVITTIHHHHASVKHLYY